MFLTTLLLRYINNYLYVWVVSLFPLWYCWSMDVMLTCLFLFFFCDNMSWLLHRNHTMLSKRLNENVLYPWFSLKLSSKNEKMLRSLFCFFSSEYWIFMCAFLIIRESWFLGYFLKNVIILAFSIIHYITSGSCWSKKNNRVTHGYKGKHYAKFFVSF